MIDPVRELKIRAELLHRASERGDPAADARLRRLAEIGEVQRKHCLAVVAREAGFASWQHAKRVLEGEETEDFGTLMHTTCGALNAWFTDYEEAAAHRAAAGGWLLPYRRQLFVTDRALVEALGLDPDDADWAAIAWDWIRPRDSAARQRLYGKRLAKMVVA